jgi:hypothetical protein
MKTLNNYIQGKESGKIVGQIINVLIAVAGAVFCIVGIYMQVSNNL